MSIVKFLLPTVVTALLLVGSTFADAQKGVATSVSGPPVGPRSGWYPNRAPLRSTAFTRLPVGSIRPGGWLRKQLQLDADGLVGHMPELSDYLKYENNGWVDPKGTAGWEELTYWLRGYGDLGYVLKDPHITARAMHWLDGVIKSQRPDGWFGPEAARTSLEGGPDLWPHMPLLNALRSYEEYTHDPRVIPFLLKFFKFQDSMPPEVYKRGWGAVRWGDNLDTVYWLYNRTGQKWLLDLGVKMHTHSANYTDGIPTWHNVNLSQGIREPAEFWQQSGEKRHLAATYRDYDEIMRKYGQFPGGGFAGDENCRPGYADPRQGFETCGWVEYMHTFEMMTRITSDVSWADRCEDIAFNSYPASLDPKHLGTHYITSANGIQLTVDGKHDGQFANGDMPMDAFMPGIHNYRCCPHNLGMGWPYYAEELWLGTSDKGICASLYAPSTVTTTVANNQKVTLEEATQYPFGDVVAFRINPAQPVAFPLYLRIPGWCAGASVKVNGSEVVKGARSGSYVKVDRKWKQGDRVTLHLPMQIAVKRWAAQGNAASVSFGPVGFSLNITEKWKMVKGPDKWPAMEVRPASPWNYGLVLAGADPAKEMVIIHRSIFPTNMPFTQATAPIAVRVKARRLPGWVADQDAVVGLLQKSPALSKEPEETLELVPMGAARLRITTFPVVSTSPYANRWRTDRSWPRISASFVHDSLKSVQQDVTPASSSDETIPRFTWWDHKGSSEWIQMDFEASTRVHNCRIYWFDDTGHGRCRVPISAQLEYLNAGEWQVVPGCPPLGCAANTMNKVDFPAINTKALRVKVQLQPEFSSGVLSWHID